MNPAQSTHRSLVDAYFATRPNLATPKPSLAVFFLASSGSGKTTIRKAIVDQFGATYTCNDEVRKLMDHPKDNSAAGVELKSVVADVWRKIMTETPNHFVVFDNDISHYYMHADSYWKVAERENVPVFVIEIDLPRQTLETRIKQRGRHDTDIVLGLLDNQVAKRAVARQDIAADFKVTTDNDLPQLLEALRQKIEAIPVAVR
ncbi:MAG TPA: AAA family ATPase [Candidatus Saccharimonadales bacterium]|jgi:predicted kinase|nr:AAA family ATPase [Candidatus Saccharimonadales bacterium]